MKIRRQDWDYVNTKRVNKALISSGQNYTSPYNKAEKKFCTDEDGIIQSYVEIKETFEVLDDGLVKCLRCYTLMIPFIEDDILMFFNLDNGKSHYTYYKPEKYYFQKHQRRKKLRKKLQWVCSL